MKKILFTACLLLGAVVSGHKEGKGDGHQKPKKLKEDLTWPFIMWSKTNIA